VTCATMACAGLYAAFPRSAMDRRRGCVTIRGFGYDVHMDADAGSRERTGVVRIGLFSDPDFPAAIVRRLSAELPDMLAARSSEDVEWQIRHVITPLEGDEQINVTDLAGTIRKSLDDDDWDVGVFITDLPRRAGIRPVAAEVAPGKRIALVSLPALGFFRLYAHTREAVLRLISELISDEYEPDAPHQDSKGHKKHVRLGTLSIQRLPADEDAPDTVRVVCTRWLGALRMVGGMVRANQPWRLFLGLSRSLAGVFATAAYGIINSTAWRFGVSLGTGRQTILAVASVILLVAWLIVDHELWERAKDVGEQARLYNATTVITLTLGVLSLYAELFVGLFFVEQLLAVPGATTDLISKVPNWSDNLGIVWFLTSAGVIGGALGSGFEDDDVVQRATYGARQRQRRRARRKDR
jgi:hypothetical protein